MREGPSKPPCRWRLQTTLSCCQIISAVQDTGKILSRELNNGQKIVLNKGFADLVTNIDYEIQSALESKLIAIIPGSTLITEETLIQNNKITDFTWILDPIDGTTNFVHSYPHFGISLALFERNRPLFGVVYNPVSQETFHAEINGGAYLNNKKIRVSRNKTIEKCIVGFGFPYDRNKIPIILAAIKNVIMECQDARRSGSAALDLCYVACGRLDGYFELDLHSWDFCAGKIILEEAGGKATNWEGANIERYDTTNILATNGQIHYDLQLLLQHPKFSVKHEYSLAMPV